MGSRRLFKFFKPPRGFKLTKAGRIYFVFLFGIMVVAMLTGNNLLFLVLAGLLGFMIVSGLESERNLRYLQIERILPSEVYARTPSRLGYHIRSRRGVSRRLVIDDRDRLKVLEVSEGPGEVCYTDYAFARRGFAELGALQVKTTFPYGLFEKSITFDWHDELIVFPEPHPIAGQSRLGPEGSGAGRAADSISHLRPYVPGDSGARIVWKKLHRGLLSRILEGGTGRQGIIVLLPGGDLEAKLSQAAFLVGEFARAGASFGLAVNQAFSGLGSSRSHKRAVLTTLALLTRIDGPPYEALNGQSNLIYL